MKDGPPLRSLQPQRSTGPRQNLVLTFNNLIGRTDFVKILGRMLAALEKAYGHPGGHRVHRARGRPGATSGSTCCSAGRCGCPASSGPVSIPADIPADRMLFRSDRFISGGEVGSIRYILYIDPRRYAAMSRLRPRRRRSAGSSAGSTNLPQIAGRPAS